MAFEVVCEGTRSPRSPHKLHSPRAHTTPRLPHDILLHIIDAIHGIPSWYQMKSAAFGSQPPACMDACLSIHGCLLDYTQANVYVHSVYKLRTVSTDHVWGNVYVHSVYKLCKRCDTA